MQRLFQFVLLQLFIVLVTTSNGRAAPEIPTNDILGMVVASVDGDPITTADLKKFMARQGAPDLSVSRDDGRVRKYLRDLISEKLVEKEAQGLSISISDDEISQYIREVQAQNRVDEDGFKALLGQQGLSMEQYRDDVRQEIVRARVVASRVRSRINVVDEDVERYVREHPDRVPGTNQVRLEQIVLKISGDEAEDAKLKAQMDEMRDAVMGGDSFVKQGGQNYQDLGFVSVDELKPLLKEKVATLALGETSDVITVDDTLVVLRIAEKAEEGVVSDAVKDEIKKELFDQSLTSALDKFLNDELPAKYSVEIKL